ncbi:hypothetical protein BST61_g3999 [Cercospora zeina]
MSDLAFGEPLDLLKNSKYHYWAASVYSVFIFGALLQCVRYFPALEPFFLRRFVPKDVAENRQVSYVMSHARGDRRLANKEPRVDIWGLVMEREGETGLSREEMYSNAHLFMIAGTETTATLLSGLLYHLLDRPETLQRLSSEIRSAFADEGDITIEKLPALKYLQACLDEGLRMYPPVPAAMPRVTVEPTVIDGNVVPPGFSVGATTLCAFRNPDNFHLPNEFHPERFLNESILFSDDRKSAFQPFLTGPRGCLGKNMAYHEMRLVVAKLLFNFDLTMCEESRNWLSQKIFLTWQRAPLHSQAKPVEH